MCGLSKQCISGGEKTAPILLNNICDAWKKKKKERNPELHSVRKQRGNRNCGSARNLPLIEPTNHRETKRNGKIWY